MAKKPIELCLELNGDDAVQFNKYMENLEDDTPEGRELMRDAVKLADRERLENL
jgi:hypothetical protein